MMTARRRQRLGCDRVPYRSVALAMALTLYSQAGSAADAVVLASSAPGYHTGKVLQDAVPLSVPEETSLSILFSNGRMVKLEGPYSGMLMEASFEEVKGAQNLQRSGGWDHSAIGGTRSAAQQARREVEIDIARGGTICVDETMEVWLATTMLPATVGLHNLETGDMAELALNEGEPRVHWPDDLPVWDGARFALAVDGADVSQLTMAVPEAPPEDAATWLGFLGIAGCEQQLGPQLEAVREQIVPLELYLASDQGRRMVIDPEGTPLLFVRANRDGYVFCHAETGDGRIVPFFPPSASEARVRSERFTIVMGSSHARAVAQSLAEGAHKARCLGFERDPGRALPDAFRAANLEPIDTARAADLLDRLASREDVAIAAIDLQKRP